MACEPSFAGRTYPPTPPYEVGREKIREFAEAVGAPPRVHRPRGRPGARLPATSIAPADLRRDRRPARATASSCTTPRPASTTAGWCTASSGSPTTARSRAGDRLVGVAAPSTTVREAGGHAMVTTRSELPPWTASRSARPRRRSSSGEGSDGHHQDRGRRCPVGDDAAAAHHPRRRGPRSCSTPAPAGTSTAIHWNERFATLRRPARRHRPRHVHHGLGRHASSPTGWATPARSLEYGTRFTKPVVVPREERRRHRGQRRGQERRRRRRGAPTVDLTAIVQRRQGARPRRGRRGPRLSRPGTHARGARHAAVHPDHDAGRRPGAAAGHGRDHRRAGRRRPRGRRRRRALLLVSAAAPTCVIADEGFAGLRRAGRHHAASPSSPRTTAAAPRSGWPPARAGTTPGGPRGRRGLVRHRGPVRHPRLRPAPPRSRTSAPTARRSPRPSPQVRAWDRREQRGRARSPTPTASSPTATAASRPSRRYVVLDVRLPAAPGRRLSAPVGLRRPRPRPRRRGGRRGCRSQDAREAVLAQRAAAGHGAGRRRPRHLELRARSSPTRSCPHERYAALRDRAREVLGADAAPPQFAAPTTGSRPAPRG